MQSEVKTENLELFPHVCSVRLQADLVKSG